MRFLFALFCSFSLFASTAYVPKDYSHLLGMPGFTKELLEMHFTLYRGYVANTNALLAKLKTMDNTTFEYGALKRRLGWEFDGMRLHELYFGNLGGDGILDKNSPLYRALSSQFGSYEQWKKDFIATGTIRGIGWAVCYLDLQQDRLMNTWINEHDVGHLAGGVPLLIMDVFEHAYMPQFGLDKAKYIEAFFKNIDWAVVSERFATSSSGRRGREDREACRRLLPQESPESGERSPCSEMQKHL